jgi:heme oxygenase
VRAATRRAEAQKDAAPASLSRALKDRTADVHQTSDALVQAKMALAFADKRVWCGSPKP